MPRERTSPVPARRDRLVFAHRGGAKLAPENTLASFERGMTKGSDGSSVTSISHATASPSSFMMPRSTAPPTPPARFRRRTADELARSTPATGLRPTPGFPFRGQGIRRAALEPAPGAVAGPARHHRTEAGFIPELARAVMVRRPPSPTPSIASASARSIGTAWKVFGPKRRDCRPAPRRRKRDGRCIAPGSAGRSPARAPTSRSRCRSEPVACGSSRPPSSRRPIVTRRGSTSGSWTSPRISSRLLSWVSTASSPIVPILP